MTSRQVASAINPVNLGVECSIVDSVQFDSHYFKIIRAVRGVAYKLMQIGQILASGFSIKAAKLGYHNTSRYSGYCVCFDFSTLIDRTTKNDSSSILAYDSILTTSFTFKLVRIVKMIFRI